MVTNMGILSKAGHKWYHNLAAGGAGLVIVESTPLSCFFPGAYGPPRFTAETLAPLAAAIHAGGARAVLQVFPTLDSIPPRAAPATVPVESLVELAAKFGEAARVCREAGFDGIEAYGAHGFILSQFSCRVTNRRTDRYGTELPTLAMELVAAAKRACPGPGFLVLFRHTVPDPTRKACFEDTAALVAALDRHGVDIFDLSPAGTYANPGCHARELKQRCGELGRPLRLPMIGDSGLNEPAKARAVLERGDLELVAVGRGHIADPQWARKVLEHREADIVRCMRCNIGCHQNLRSRKPIRCVRSKDVDEGAEVTPADAADCAARAVEDLVQ